LYEFVLLGMNNPQDPRMNVTPSAPVLLVEDDLDLAGNIQDYLEHRGWQVDYAPNGALGLHQILSSEYSAVILDLRLPGLDGVELCRRLRTEIGSALPVLMLTAADTLNDRLGGFEAGADDYLVKPFALPELLARLQALIRRVQAYGAGASKILRFADVELDRDLRTVRRAGQLLTVTKMGYDFLEILMQRAPAVVPRADIEHHLWHGEPPGSDALRTHLAALRAVLDRPPWPALLHTHRGIGYQLIHGKTDDV
jgi:DNA-binding response OmpR family regulator